MQHIISSILPIFIITLIGKLIRTYWLKSDEFWRGLETLSYYMLFPIVLFIYISNAEIGSAYIIRLVVALILSTIFTSLLLITSQKYFSIEGKIFTSIFQGAIRYNSYIFFALGDALYGDKGMVIISVIAAYMIIFTNFLSVLAFSIYAPINQELAQRRGISQWSLFIKNLFTNPLVLASIAGFLCNHFNIELSESLEKTMKMLSESALAVGIMCVGASLRISIVKLDKLAVIVSCFAKLIIMPFVTIIVLKLVGIKGLAYSIGILYSALPSATNSYLLAKQLGGDSETMSSIITISILLSVLSLASFTYILS